jgi:hypothetical protein
VLRIRRPFAEPNWEALENFFTRRCFLVHALPSEL